ncbi:hypothetical protein QJS65_10620 [Bacillus altitudinis]|uniref:hypothetical protein n=1 Tax=Bacillus altitudinis TaxID=293387 RepID=UPI001F61ABEE|nr:hypothetical protein [Bacillus altitudinis]WHF25302.1 hypothetical protein QJS65_10620 [Bacillus altitudinis]
MKSMFERMKEEMEEVNEVYYKIYISDKSMYSVVTLQWFDELDYRDSDFLANQEGNHLKFERKEDALEWLFLSVPNELIDLT